MKKKEMIPLANEENKSYLKRQVCYICKKEFSIDDNDNGNAFKNTIKYEIIVITQENIETLLIIFVA